MFGRFLRRGKLQSCYTYTCPICRYEGEMAQPSEVPFPCPHCRRRLYAGNHLLQPQGR